MADLELVKQKADELLSLLSSLSPDLQARSALVLNEKLLAGISLAAGLRNDDAVSVAVNDGATSSATIQGSKQRRRTIKNNHDEQLNEIEDLDGQLNASDKSLLKVTKKNSIVDCDTRQEGNAAQVTVGRARKRKLTNVSKLNGAVSPKHLDESVLGDTQAINEESDTVETQLLVVNVTPKKRGRPRKSVQVSGDNNASSETAAAVDAATTGHVSLSNDVLNVKAEELKSKVGRRKQSNARKRKAVIEVDNSSEDNDVGDAWREEEAEMETPVDQHSAMRAKRVATVRKRFPIVLGMRKRGRRPLEKAPKVKRHIGRPSKDEVEAVPDELKPHVCSICTKRFMKELLLRAHVKRVHLADKKFTCRFCGKVYNYHAVWYNHEKTHRDECHLKCPHCPYKTPQKVYLEQHIRSRHTKEKPYLCDTCGAGFAVRKHMEQHRKSVHIRSERFFCDQCPFVSHSKQCLDIHLRNKHDDLKKKYKCDICGVVLNYRDSYKCHMRRHYDEKPFKCDECGRCFASTSQRSQHMRIHQERTIQCSVCNKKFLSKHHLVRHEVIHTGAKNFECPMCSYKCNVQQNLRKHCKETHHLVYPPLLKKKIRRVKDGNEVANTDDVDDGGDGGQTNGFATAVGVNNSATAQDTINGLPQPTVPLKKIRRRRNRNYIVSDVLPVNNSSSHVTPTSAGSVVAATVLDDGMYATYPTDMYAVSSSAIGSSWQYSKHVPLPSQTGLVVESTLPAETYVSQEAMQVIMSNFVPGTGTSASMHVNYLEPIVATDLPSNGHHLVTGAGLLQGVSGSAQPFHHGNLTTAAAGSRLFSVVMIPPDRR